MAPQASNGAEPQSGSAERLTAFRHHIVIIEGISYGSLISASSS